MHSFNPKALVESAIIAQKLDSLLYAASKNLSNFFFYLDCIVDSCVSSIGLISAENL